MDPKLVGAVRKVIELLVRRNYRAIEQLTNARRLSAEQLKSTVEEYGRTLQLPPDGDLRIDAIEVAGARPKTWSVRCDLWTVEEGHSDLTLELTVREGAETYSVETDGLHVL
ncbi:MAG: DUF7668 domain-containing protein [Myxococcaceae bacterium]